jgi:hypothetical protein
LFGWDRKKLIGEDKKFIHPLLRAEVEYIKKEAEEGRVVPHVTIHRLKDETRPLDRVSKAYTRAFQIGSIQMLIFHRMSVGFYLFQTEHDQKSEIAVGLNPYSTHWDQMGEKLRQFDHFGASDVGGWDLRYMSPQLAYLFHTPLTTTYSIDPNGKHGRCIKATMLQTFTCLILMADGRMYYACIMISGSFGTSGFNTVFNSAKTRTIFIYLREKHGISPIVKFKDNALARKFGDDSVEAWLKAIHAWFNGKTVAQAAKELFDHEHTDPRKGNNIPESMKMEELEFLCRKWKFMMGVWTAPLSTDSLHNMVQWVNKSDTATKEQQMRINMENALREWALHGQEQYEKYQKQYNQFLRMARQPPINETFSNSLEIMLSFKDD